MCVIELEAQDEYDDDILWTLFITIYTHMNNICKPMKSNSTTTNIKPRPVPPMNRCHLRNGSQS